MIAVVVVTCGELAFFRLRIFDLFGTMQEHYHIGVLFDCARFAKVGKLRFFPALLGTARQLRKHQKRHAEFFCIKFHLTTHRRDFLLAVFGLRLRIEGDKLQVVDDDEVEPPRVFHTAAFADDIARGVARVVVDENFTV